MLRMGIEFVPDNPIKDIVEWAKLAEEVGFDNIWITDHYNNRNLWVTVTAIALNTKRVVIGPGVTNPYHTSPALSAAAIATVNEISGGRAAIGLGAGDRVTLETLGIEWKKPVSTVVEGITLMRSLITGDRVNFEGQMFHINGAKLTHVKKTPQYDVDGNPIMTDGKQMRKAPKIPIYAGVQGPIMLEKTAAVADGILVNASHPKDIGEAMRRIRTGLARVNRSIDDLDIGAYTAFSIARTSQNAMAGNLKLIVAYIVAGSPDAVLQRHNLDLSECAMIRKLLSDGRTAELDKAVSDSMIDVFAVVGTSDQCIDRIEQLIKAGVTQLIVGSPIGPDKTTAIKQIGQEIIPYFRDSNR